MADRTPNSDAIEFGAHLTALRTAAGNPSFGEIERTILLNTNGAIRVSDQQIGNYHQGKSDPRKVRVEVLVALCRVYGCQPADLGPVAAAEIAALLQITSSTERFVSPGWLRLFPELAAGVATTLSAA